MVEEKRRVGKKCDLVRNSYLHPPPRFTKNFQGVVRLFSCDRLLKVVRNVVTRAIKGECCCFFLSIIMITIMMNCNMSVYPRLHSTGGSGVGLFQQIHCSFVL